MHKLQAQWMDSIERALEIFERYAMADRERKAGAVTYVDPLTTEPELVDAHTARTCYRQVERALKVGQLGSGDADRYLVARERLVASSRPGAMRQVGDTVCRGQKLEGDAFIVSSWMIQAFAKAFHQENTIAENASNPHGLFTLCYTLASLGRRLPAYAVDALEVHFRAPVCFGDSITPGAEVQEILEGGQAVLQFRALSQEGKIVCEGTVTLRPEKPGEILPTPPAELQWLRQWAQDVTPSVPTTDSDFTKRATPRQQTFAKTITPELGRATQALFGPLYPHQLSPLLAIGTMAMTSAGSSPGHPLLTARVLHFRGPIEAGEEMSIMVTAPSPDQIRHSQNGKGNSIVPLDIMLMNERGALVLQGQVVTLRAES